jgi:hypothetical protein
VSLLQLAGRWERAVTSDQLTAALAERVMGWRVTPERFLKGDRRWAPRWQFQPFRRLEHALQLLDNANGQYTLTKAAGATFTAQVTIGCRVGSASGKSEAATISLALARSLGIDPETID